MPHLTQTNFTAGELTTRLDARVDLDKYGNGAALLDNFLVHPHGGISKRPGLEMVYGTEGRDRVENGDFAAAGASWTIGSGAGWTLTSNGAAHSSGSSGNFSQDLELDLNRLYTVTWTIDSNAGGQVRVKAGDGDFGPWRSVTGTFSDILRGGVSDPALAVEASTDFTGKVTSLEVRELGPPARLIDFKYSTEQAYQLELTDKLMRFYYQGAGIVLDGSDPVELETPWAEADLSKICCVQSADVMYFTCEGYAPRKLSRYSHISWTMEEIIPANGPWTIIDDDAEEVFTLASNTGSGVAITCSGADYFTSDHIGRMLRLNFPGGDEYTEWGYGQIASVLSGSNATMDILRDMTPQYILNGEFEDDLSFWSNQSEDTATISHDDVNDRLELTGTSGNNAIAEQEVELEPNTAYTLTIDVAAVTTALNVRVGKTSDGDDYVSETITTTGVHSFDFTPRVDTIYLQIFHSVVATNTVNSVSLKRKELVSDTYQEGAWDEDKGYPEVCAFHENRLFFMRGERRWGSRTGDYEDFGESTDGTLLDDDMVEFTTISEDVQSIRWAISARRLLMGTTGGEWWATGENESSGMTPTGIETRQESTHGSAHTAPIRVGQAVLFVQRDGKVTREFLYDFGVDGWVSTDVSIMAEHLFRASQVAGWCYQQAPDSIVFGYLDDGSAFTITYKREHKVVAFTRFSTWGDIESLSSIPGDGHDEVWSVVRRWIKWQGWDLTIEDSNVDSFADGQEGDTFTLPAGRSFSSGCVVNGDNSAGASRVYQYVGEDTISASSNAATTVTFKDSPVASNAQVKSIYTSGGALNSDYWRSLATAYTPRRYVERLAAEHVGSSAIGAFLVDSGLEYDAPLEISDISQTDPAVVTTSEAHGLSSGDRIVVRDVDTIASPDGDVVAGMDEVNGNLYLTSAASGSTFKLVDVNTGQGVDATGFMAYMGGGYVRKLVDQFSGLDHLEGLEVQVLGDGAVLPPCTVTAGKITTARKAATLAIGLGYDADLLTLNPEFVSRDKGSTQGKLKRIVRVVARLESSGPFLVGTDADNTKREDISLDPPELFTGDNVCGGFDGGHDERAQIFMRADLPVPFHLLGVIAEIRDG